MKKFYYYFYYRTYHFAIKISDDALNEIKPGAFLVALEVILYSIVLIWIEILKIVPKATLDLLWSNTSLVFIVLLLVTLNYFIFLYRDKWKQYANEFSNYNKKKKFWYGVIMLLAIALIVGGLIFSFYRLSQMKR